MGFILRNLGIKEKIIQKAKKMRRPQILHSSLFILH